MNPAVQTIEDTIFTAIDFESAGSAPGFTDQPIQIGLASWSVRSEKKPSSLLSSSTFDHFVSYLRCDQKITWQAQKIHAITASQLVEAPRLLSLWPEINSRLNPSAVVAHGHGTEKRFLRAFPGHTFHPWIDTLTLSRSAWPRLSSHSLHHLCSTFDLIATIKDVLPERNWHDALFDAVASLYLLRHLIDVLELTAKPLDFLINPDLSPYRQSRHQSL